ncbi:hypothetical protein [Bdellovibrio bacteriovorus]|uniref:HNH endonuclease n=1 Tax=Bdellovibrio bacteriovorus TaxID=959 RepID=A0A162G7J4_BDEBC|nr:hypothetical protein [Bdellovibrio bacteriovorus]KYG65194.1 hypothetical protein AZI87_11555 [Bdellovibrio bacteriovorus]
MFKSVALLAVVVLCSTVSHANGNFPKGPDANLTPGALCSRADSYRYPEHIKYCERDVSSSQKAAIFQKYDQLGYRTRSMKRQAFKIDHYIPLCAGGSNSPQNLWPQHESVYQITDQLEALVCEKMAAGRLKQKEAVELIMQAKNHLDEVPEIQKYVNSL